MPYEWQPSDVSGNPGWVVARQVRAYLTSGVMRLPDKRSHRRESLTPLSGSPSAPVSRASDSALRIDDGIGLYLLETSRPR